MLRRLIIQLRQSRQQRRFAAVVAFVFTAGLLVIGKIDDSTLAGNIRYVQELPVELQMRYESTRNAQSDAVTATPTLSPLRKCNSQVVRLAICVRSVDDARQAAAMLKTVLRRRSSPLDLHFVVGSELASKGIQTLLNTWELGQVTFSIHRISPELINVETWSMVKFMLDKLLPATLDQILYISNNVRLLDDVTHLWHEAFDNGSNAPVDHLLTVASVVNRTCRDNREDACQSYDLLGVSLRSLRKMPENSTLQPKSSQADFRAFLASFQDRLSTATIHCSWTVPVKSGAINYGECLPVRGVLWSEKSTTTYTGNDEIEAAKEVVQIVAKSYSIGDFRLSSSGPCAVAESRAPATPDGVLPNVAAPARDCEEFRRAVRMKRRTHLYFAVGVGDENPASDRKSSSSSSGKGVDITLATQLTIDRFSALERMLSTWEGPASVALHVTDEEAEGLPSKISQSAVLKNRRRISYHLVYKRLMFNPINYLRNVAVNNSMTSYVFYVDVDLVPNSGMYEQLKTWIRRIIVDGKNNTKDLALIIPAFSSDETIAMPSNKTELLQLMAADKVSGYSMKRNWNYGHKPTDFDRWTRGSEPYYVTYKDAFEPYVVVRMDSSPRFNEHMFERFADKAMYIRTLHATGFKLCVLPDVFVLHLPHLTSGVFWLYKIHPFYQRCASVISGAYKDELKSRYPNVLF